MPLHNPKPPLTVRRFRVELDEEWIEHNFGRDVPVDVAITHARRFLDAHASKETNNVD